ncbi:hypothetical protein Skr01_73180 [Sphaerisporangium krabiense]|uniref:Uncharacterized protein n=1 Tax=Sphaerisporangium krabiense TaxID=763782 RepID=A0A7W8Z915_9ACTN|nr:hypothetical protein [Sphaerisporangium krabiense]MBB5629576.1 hypothetical protein [Sphaerisporangium krabiense]GII67233.1 hypothetical protein Skr01_73180 [Sphaerisporangium krabiense]
MEGTSARRDHEALVTARRVARALGYTAAEVTELAVDLGGDGRRDWPTADLLLAALAELTRRDPARRDLVGAAEAGEILGLTPTDVLRLAERPEFPEPRYTLAAGDLWARADIVAFHAREAPRLTGR